MGYLTPLMSNWEIWGALAFATLFIGFYAFVRPHHPEDTPPKHRK